MSTIPLLPGEIWRDVPGYEGLYEVSNRGRVWSSYRGGRLLTLITEGHSGYQRLGVRLWDGETKWQVRVHQLVMLAFVGPCPAGQEVRHLDGNPFRNWWPENLAYGTHKQNGEDMAAHGTSRAGVQRGTQHSRAKLTEDLVVQIRAEYAAGGVTDAISRQGTA
jgi:hypothetical protein